MEIRVLPRSIHLKEPELGVKGAIRDREIGLDLDGDAAIRK